MSVAMASVGLCAVEGCELRRYCRGFCKMHYDRFQRHGEVGPAGRMKARWGEGNTRPDGYSKVYRIGHPLAARDGRIYVHRLVLFEVIGEGPHPCHWCGRSVNWLDAGDGRLVVDHLDFDRRNDTPVNLAPACHPCNSGRTTRWLV